MNLSEHIEIAEIIEENFAISAQLSPKNTPKALKRAIEEVFNQLSNGSLRIASKHGDEWRVHEWVKKAILLSFKIFENQCLESTEAIGNFYDKIPLKYADHNNEAFKAAAVRIVPPTCVRTGAYIAPNVVLMPSFVNIGAYIGEGSMIDSWATVGSCAQIGARVHLSMGAGIGGVLEPLQANPTIIEDDCFIGAGSKIVEGIIVEAGSVIGMGVFIGQSTKIYDRERDCLLQGHIPAGSVVIPGSLPSKNGKYSVNCAVIVKRVDAKTRAKLQLNDLLRDLD